MFKYQKILQRAVLNRYHQKTQFLHTLPTNIFKLTEEVAEGLLSKKPVVALESTVITHGLPYPENLQCAVKLEEIIRENKAIPATIGILNGIVHIGMELEALELLSHAKDCVKVSRRDFPYALSKKINGGTTVAATMILAHQATIPVFATGGIGGVHRGAETSMDISADLYELSRTPMTVISAGVKSILDIGLTLEYLETLGVCVATFGKSKAFPSFFTEQSGFSSPCNVETVEDAAQLINCRDSLHLDSGILLAVPIPQQYKEDGEKAHSVIQKALEEARKKKIMGKNITPFVLEQVRLLSEGASLRANIGLLENNARVGSQIAVKLNEIKLRGGSSSSRTMLSPVHHEASNVISSSKPVVIGGSVLDIHVKVLEDIKMDGRTVGGKVQSTAGGVGRNVADCMARLGADPFFLSVVGAQEYSETLLSKMDHMDLRGIKIIQDARTATCVVVLDQNGECVFVVGDMTVHGRLSPEQVENYSDVIAKAPMVVIDSNITPETSNRAMNLCSKHQVPVWFEPTDISCATRPFEGSAWRSAITYASPNLNELRVMHDKIFGKATLPLQDPCLERKLEEGLRLGIPLLTDALHTLVVTLASHGILLITKVAADGPFPTANVSQKLGNVRAIHYPARIPENIISVSGAGDCFAAAMITAILRGSQVEECINAGQLAATISLASHHAVPDLMCSDAVFDNIAIPMKKPVSVL